jgi:hypothetical protein
LLAYLAYIRVATKFGALAPIKAQAEVWGRHFRGPIVGVWGALKNGLVAARHVLGGGTDLSAPTSVDQEGLINLAALGFASVGVIGTMRACPPPTGPTRSPASCSRSLSRPSIWW